MGTFIYFTDIEQRSPGMTSVVILAVIIFASAGGFLTFDSGNDLISPVMEQWGFAFIFILLNLGWFFNKFRRESE